MCIPAPKARLRWMASLRRAMPNLPHASATLKEWAFGAGCAWRGGATPSTAAFAGFQLVRRCLPLCAWLAVMALGAPLAAQADCCGGGGAGSAAMPNIGTFARVTRLRLQVFPGDHPQTIDIRDPRSGALLNQVAIGPSTAHPTPFALSVPMTCPAQRLAPQRRGSFADLGRRGPCGVLPDYGLQPGTCYAGAIANSARGWGLGLRDQA